MLQYKLNWLLIGCLFVIPCAATADDSPIEANSERVPAPDKKSTWLSDMDEAQALAAKSGKPILMDFTGSDWCSWCIKLSEEVFSNQEFQDWAEKHVILVELDFPSDESKLSPETKQHHDKWLKSLQVEGFPSVVLVDPNARPFAQTGFQAGGPEAYIKHLTQLMQVRLLRDTAMGLAKDAEGPEKARYLNDALSTMDAKIAGLHYTQEIETIQEFGDDRLREKYERLLLDAQGGAEVAGMDREEWMSDPFGFIGTDMTSASASLDIVKTKPPVDEYHPRIESRLAKLIELMTKT